MNTEESTNDICDHCKISIEECECEFIHCQKCEDGMPRKHNCAEDQEFCEHCDAPIEECECQPSDLY